LKIKLKKMQNKCLWFLGLSGAGKTTLATHLMSSLQVQNKKCILLDGDVLRQGINNNLGFSDEDRCENVRRAAEVAKLFLNEGYWVVVALITPFESMRKNNRAIIGNDYLEFFVNSSLELCQHRDPKGLYAKVAQKQITNFTGIDSPFEIPILPDFIVKTNDKSIEECNCMILEFIFSEKS
jgi:adenylylsulfate kinase